jgi:hypothetical protein
LKGIARVSLPPKPPPRRLALETILCIGMPSTLEINFWCLLGSCEVAGGSRWWRRRVVAGLGLGAEDGRIGCTAGRRLSVCCLEALRLAFTAGMLVPKGSAPRLHSAQHPAWRASQPMRTMFQGARGSVQGAALYKALRCAELRTAPPPSSAPPIRRSAPPGSAPVSSRWTGTRRSRRATPRFRWAPGRSAPGRRGAARR